MKTEVKRIGDGRIVVDGETYVNEKSKRVMSCAAFREKTENKPSSLLLIDREKIQERIKQLENLEETEFFSEHKINNYLGQIEALQSIIAQAAPADELIKKTFDESRTLIDANPNDRLLDCEWKYPTYQDYLNSL